MEGVPAVMVGWDRRIFRRGDERIEVDACEVMLVMLERLAEHNRNVS